MVTLILSHQSPSTQSNQLRMGNFDISTQIRKLVENKFNKYVYGLMFRIVEQ